jgi:hypothetical protein
LVDEKTYCEKNLKQISNFELKPEDLGFSNSLFMNAEI